MFYAFSNNISNVMLYSFVDVFYVYIIINKIVTLKNIYIIITIIYN